MESGDGGGKKAIKEASLQINKDVRKKNGRGVGGGVVWYNDGKERNDQSGARKRVPEVGIKPKEKM